VSAVTKRETANSSLVEFVVYLILGFFMGDKFGGAIGFATFFALSELGSISRSLYIISRNGDWKPQ
jgi:hypothetical protein